MAYLINLTHLQKSYGKQTVLHDINLNVMPK